MCVPPVDGRPIAKPLSKSPTSLQAPWVQELYTEAKLMHKNGLPSATSIATINSDLGLCADPLGPHYRMLLPSLDTPFDDSRIPALAPARFRRALGVLMLAMLSLSTCAAAATPSATYLGNVSCASCHEAQIADWHGSHHDLAMQEATEATVLGDFNNAEFRQGDLVTRFYRRDGGFWVSTEGETGEREDFPVRYVFGVYPLQQLLLPLDVGRLQALTIAWDARPKAEGGQRWYSLFPDEVIKSSDPLHWTGPYHNWNTRCAECHSTDVKKRYDATTRSFETQYASIDVGCEACHGPGSRHVELANANALESSQLKGFAMDLAARGHWSFADGESIARRQEPLNSNTQIDTCGRCHARRSTLGDYHYGADLLDTHRLALVETPLYWPDGQIRDEVYVYGSFIQSKMHQAGVVCSNCHNPHSGQLLAEGNALCAQCHQPERYDQTQHHHHPAGSEGGQCVSCHMPEQIYMGVDGRRDHSMRIPRPELSLTTGSPNACTQCHTEQSASWALERLEGWGYKRSGRQHPALAFHAAQRGDLRALPSLKHLVDAKGQPAIVRASALSLYGQMAPPDLARTAAMLLGADDALIRAAAVRASAALPAGQRFLMLRTLIDDPVLAVRMAVAEQLADAPMNELRPKDIAQLEPLFAEYVRVQSQHLDMPSIQVQLANFWRNRGDITRAESALREALKINPQLEAAIINLSDLLRATQRENEAKALLEQSIAEVAAPGGLHHALGLLEIRAGRRDQALIHLGEAARLEREGSRHRYVYAVALHDMGKPTEAVSILERLNTERPGNPETLYALIGYAQELGDQGKVGRYQAQLQALAQQAGLR